jgi:hypothetical protein
LAAGGFFQINGEILVIIKVIIFPGWRRENEKTIATFFQYFVGIGAVFSAVPFYEPQERSRCRQADGYDSL